MTKRICKKRRSYVKTVWQYQTTTSNNVQSVLEGLPEKFDRLNNNEQKPMRDYYRIANQGRVNTSTVTGRHLTMTERMAKLSREQPPNWKPLIRACDDPRLNFERIRATKPVDGTNVAV